jgi:hypothetical protein
MDDGEQAPLVARPGPPGAAGDALDAARAALHELRLRGGVSGDDLGDEPFERRGAQVGREVQDEANGAGQGESPVGADVGGGQVIRAVDRDPRTAAALAGAQQLDRSARVRWQDAEDGAGASSGEHGARHGEQRRAFPAERRQQRRADGEDAAVLGMQPAGAHAPLPLAAADAERAQLGDGDEVLLRSSDLRDAGIVTLALRRHVGVTKTMYPMVFVTRTSGAVTKVTISG